MVPYEWKTGVAGFVELDDVKLEAMCFGPRPQDAPTIVMLHEGLGCVALWRDLPQILSKETGHGVFVYSRAGYGQSLPCELPRPPDYMTREAMDVLPSVLDAIGFREGILFGHSDGATIAAIHAGMSGDRRVRGAVLMAPHFFGEETGLEAILVAKNDFETGDLRARLEKYHADVDCAFYGWNNAWLSPAMKDWNVAETIDYLRVPVLAIQGGDDPYGTLAQIEEIESRSYAPVDVEIFDDCGHAPQTEKPVETRAAIVEFVTRLQRIESEKVETARTAVE